MSEDRLLSDSDELEELEGRSSSLDLLLGGWQGLRRPSVFRFDAGVAPEASSISSP